MHRKWLGAALLAVLAAGCGEGHAIFNVDVQSFMASTGADTLRVPPDPLPGILPGDPPVRDSITPVGVDLPTAMSSSIVDTVLLTGSLDVTHSTGSGTFSYDVFFSSSSDPAVVYAGSPALTVGPVSIPTTAPVPITSQNLAAVVGDAFKGSALYVGIRATVSNTGATNLQSTFKLTALQARIVLQDRIFAGQ